MSITTPSFSFPPDLSAATHLLSLREAQASVPEPVPDAEPDVKALAPALAAVRLREAAFPILSEYDIASATRIAGELWADSQITGNTEDEAAAATLAKTLKGVRERHQEEIELGGCCGCGPTSCCC